MTTLHPTSINNVTATLNIWLRTSLNAYTLPAWLPSFSLVVTMPEKGIVPPAFGVFHIGGMSDERQNTDVDETATLETGMMDVSAYVSRSNKNWIQQLRTMEQMVKQSVAGRGVLRIQDYSVPAAPTSTDYVVRLLTAETVPTQPDANPDLERCRILVRYRWFLRSSIN